MLLLCPREHRYFLPRVDQQIGVGITRTAQRESGIVTARTSRWLYALPESVAPDAVDSGWEADSAARRTDGLLRALVARGFVFVHPTDDRGRLEAVVGVRAHDGVVDVVHLRAERDVHATRVPGSEVDLMSPRRLLWQASGFVDDVLVELLALPDAPETLDDSVPVARGGWVPLRPGTTKWISTSA